MDDDTLAYVAITRVQRAYADLTTRQAWSEMPRLFLPDGGIQFNLTNGTKLDVPAAEIGAFGRDRISQFDFFEYVPLNTVVTVAADGTARGRAYQMEIAQDRESGAWITFFGVYDDEYTMMDSRWLFGRRRYNALARKVDGNRADVVPFPSSDL